MKAFLAIIICLLSVIAVSAKTAVPSRFDSLLQRYFFNPYIKLEDAQTMNFYRRAPATKDSIRFPKPADYQGARFYQVKRQSYFKTDSNYKSNLFHLPNAPNITCAYPSEEAQRREQRTDFSCQYRASIHPLPGDEFSFTAADLIVDWSKNIFDDKEYDRDLFRNEIKSITVVFHFDAEAGAVRAFQTMKDAFSETGATSNNAILVDRKVYAANFSNGHSFVTIRNRFDERQYTILITLRLTGRV